LFWVSGHGAGGVMVGSSRRRARGNVRTRRRPGAGWTPCLCIPA